MVKVSNNYRQAFVEVEAVLNCLNDDEYNKIPVNVVEAIKENKDEKYIYKYDPNAEYSSWNLMPETTAILYNLYKEYLATEEKKKELKQKERIELYKIEEEKIQKYNSENIFENTELSNKQEKNSDFQIAKYKESIFKIFVNKIKGIFKK